MRTILLFTILTAALMPWCTAQAVTEPVFTAEQMRAFLMKRPEKDQIRWKDPARGGALEVRILAVDDKGVSVQKTTPKGLITRSLLMADLAGASFALTPLEERLIGHPVAASVPALRVLWEARSATLGMESSNVADVGIALSKALRMSKQVPALEQAASLLDQILGKEPADHRKAVVKGELQTLEIARAILNGPPEETDKLAWKITTADDNPEAMLMATAWLADRHFADLKLLQEEHPRWDEDDEVRPLRIRLYNLSLDFALYPSLFQGMKVDEASAGLKKVWEVYQYTNSPQLAIQALEDLAALYPDSQAAKDTAEELSRIKAREAAGKLAEQVAAVVKTVEDAVDEDGVSNVDEQSGLPKIPPPPKRYNLFDD